MRVVIIGGGPGGTEVARRSVQNSHQVTIVERGQFGGTCTNRGCIPTKFLLSSLLQETARSGGEVTQAAWKKIQKRKKALLTGLSRKIENDLAQEGVTIMKGEGKLGNSGQVLCTTPDGTTVPIEADVTVLATGSSPLLIPSFSIDRHRVLTSDEALELDNIPASIIIVGSGFIGSELARIFSMLGTRVTLLEALGHILPMEDEDTAAVVQQQFDRHGINTATGIKVSSVETNREGATVTLEDGQVFQAELALVSVGRQLNTAALGLETAGISTGKSGAIEVDGYLETSSSKIYAVGDITGQAMLAHVATQQGMVVAEHIGGNAKPIDYRAVPWAVFVSPEVATAGLTEKAAAAKGIAYVKGKALFSGNIKARLDTQQKGFIKILADPVSGILLGGCVVGLRASEMIHTLSAAIQRGLTADEFAHEMFIHPTLSESFREAAENLR